MSIEFYCPACDALLRTPDQKAGLAAKCPHCSNRIWIPNESEKSIAPKSPEQQFQMLAGPDFRPSLTRNEHDLLSTESLCSECGSVIENRASRCPNCHPRLPSIAAPGDVDLGRILEETWSIYSQNLGACFAVSVIDFLLTLVSLALALVVAVSTATIAGQHPLIAVLIFFTVTGLVLTVSVSFLAIGHVHYYLDLCRSRRPDMQLALTMRGPASAVAVGGAVYWGLAVFVLPMIFLWPFSRVIIDQKKSGVASLVHALRMTSGHSGVCLGLALVKLGGLFVANLIPVFGQLLYVPYCATLNTVAYLHMSGEAD